MNKNYSLEQTKIKGNIWKMILFFILLAYKAKG